MIQMHHLWLKFGGIDGMYRLGFLNGDQKEAPKNLR